MVKKIARTLLFTVIIFMATVLAESFKPSDTIERITFIASAIVILLLISPIVAGISLWIGHILGKPMTRMLKAISVPEEDAQTISLYACLAFGIVVATGFYFLIGYGSVGDSGPTIYDKYRL